MSAQLFDTHAHIHFPDYGLNSEDVLKKSQEAGVKWLMAVGCRLKDSELAIKFAKKHQDVWAAVGIHPHEAEDFLKLPSNKIAFEALLSHPEADKVVAIGECGLDYYYNNSDKQSQVRLFSYQLDLAQELDLPVIFHVREAFEDFWPIVDRYKLKSGVVHSFTAHKKELQNVLERGFYVGLNGVATFTKDQEQLAAIKDVPLSKLVLETDAPYLTPKPFRGSICEPKHVIETTKFLAELRGESYEQLADSTSRNAKLLFGLH